MDSFDELLTRLASVEREVTASQLDFRIWSRRAKEGARTVDEILAARREKSERRSASVEELAPDPERVDDKTRDISGKTSTEQTRCKYCDSNLRPGNRFCTNCGMPAAKQPPSVELIRCLSCQTDNRPGIKFCTKCGTGLVLTREVKCLNCDTPARKGLKFCTNCGYSLAVVNAGRSTGSRSIVQTIVDLPSQSMSTGGLVDSVAPSVARLHRSARSVMPVIFGSPGSSSLPNLRQPSLKAPLPRMQPIRVFNLGSGPARDVARQASQSFRTATRVGGKEAELPPQPGLWSFRRSTGNLVPSSLRGRRDAGQQSASGLTQALGRVIRAVLFEANIYREVAANSKVKWEAWIITLATIFAASLGAIFFSLIRGTFGGILSLPGIFLIQAIAWLVSVWAMHAGATLWLKSPLSYNQFFRALSYGRIPAVFQFIPILGYLTIPWVAVAHAAAIRDLTGGSTVKSTVLTIAGLVAMIIAIAIVGPAVGYIF